MDSVHYLTPGKVVYWRVFCPLHDASQFVAVGTGYIIGQFGSRSIFQQKSHPRKVEAANLTGCTRNPPSIVLLSTKRLPYFQDRHDGPSMAICPSDSDSPSVLLPSVTPAKPVHSKGEVYFWGYARNSTIVGWYLTETPSSAEGKLLPPFPQGLGFWPQPQRIELLTMDLPQEKLVQGAWAFFGYIYLQRLRMLETFREHQGLPEAQPCEAHRVRSHL